MTFSVENLEFYLLVLVRISAFVMAAPILGNRTVPRNVKFAISFFMSIIVIQLIDVTPLDYVGVIGYSTLVLKEAAVGVALGYAANLCFYIVNRLLNNIFSLTFIFIATIISINKNLGGHHEF